MKLVIDYGNTLIKIAVFNKDSLIDLRLFKKISVEQLKLLIDEFELKYDIYNRVRFAIISSVIRYPVEIKEYLESTFSFIELNNKTKLPVKTKYKTPETLGNDRIAAVVAASGLFPSADLLIIDAGTCITYDFINSKKEHYGGGISPGINMRFKALNTFTDKLPLISRNTDTELIGCSTEGSIQSGVLNGILAEVDEIINRYKQDFPSIKIIFTGGDMKYFERRLKNNIFANSNLVLTGLNMILNFNFKK